jgi:heat shock protein HslJ
MYRITRLPILLLVAVTTMLSACDGGWRSSADGELTGSRWRLVGWRVSSLAASDFQITATFTDREIRGTSAVNQYIGTYSAESGSFATGDVSMTEIAGPEPEMRAERIYLQFLRDARRYDRRARDLVLLDANGNELLYFSPAP